MNSFSKVEANVEENQAAAEVPAKEFFEIKNANGDGFVKVAPGVIATIVREQALLVDGLVRLAPAGLVEGIADVFSKRTYERSIGIDFSDEGVTIALTVILRYGVLIPEVTANLRNSVKSAVETQVGAKVDAVNILVKELEKVEPAAEEKEGEEEVFETEEKA